LKHIFFGFKFVFNLSLNEINIKFNLMELSLEKNFEKKKRENNIQMMDNTKEGTNQDSPKKNSFNINEIKAYLENNNYNNDTSNEENPHLITDINNHFSSRKELLQESLNNEDLVMNQSYNYNPNISQNSSKNPSQNILQISQNMEENESNFDVNYPNIFFQSEKKFFNPPQIFPDISTKKSTKTSISVRDKENSYKNQSEEEIDDRINNCNYKESLNDNNKEKIFEEKEKSTINKEEECKNVEIEKSESIKKSNNKVKNNYIGYKEYEKKIIEKEDDIFDVEIEEDTFGKYVDSIIKRSYHVYKNRQCPSCANLLSKGKSCIKCPKYHHLIKSGKK